METKKNPCINIQGSSISCESTVKLLGIEIDYQLNFDVHIGNICRKASQQLNILKRLGPYLDRLSKLTIFHTFILSNFNFCPWYFCTERNSNKIGKSAGTSTPFCVRGLFELIRTIIRKGEDAFHTDKTSANNGIRNI